MLDITPASGLNAVTSDSAKVSGKQQVNFHWWRARGGVFHEAQWLDLSTTSDFRSGTFKGYELGLSAEHLTIDPVDQGTYYWRINTRIDGIWYPSGTKSLTVAPPPGPGNGMGPIMPAYDLYIIAPQPPNTAEFHWTRASGGWTIQGQWIELSTSLDFFIPTLARSLDIYQDTYTWRSLATGKYNWRIKTKIDGEYYISPVAQVAVTSTKLIPATNLFAGVWHDDRGHGATFWWTGATGGMTHQAQWLDVCNGPDFEALLFSPACIQREIALDIHLHEIVPLDPGTYWWRINTLIDDVWQTSEVKSFVIEGEPEPPPSESTIDFVATPISGSAPLVVSFEGIYSEPLSGWMYTFGDGEQELGTDVVHTYREPGKFGAVVHAYTASGEYLTSGVKYITVTGVAQPPVASFTAEPSSGLAPLRVYFKDTSQGVVESRLWRFGDGDTHTIPQPVHTYEEAGTYTAQLTVYGTAGQRDSCEKTIIVTVPATPPPPNGGPAAPEPPSYMPILLLGIGLAAALILGPIISGPETSE